MYCFYGSANANSSLYQQAIHGYRETERNKWSKSSTLILQRLHEAAFPNAAKLPQAHILDLAPSGVIKPHVDSVRVSNHNIFSKNRYKG